MEHLENFINHCYLEKGNDHILVYKLVKVKERYGLLCHEVQTMPYEVWVYEDFPTEEEISEEGYSFLEGFIPELDDNCEAKPISEGHYIELITRIQVLYEKRLALENQIKNFIEEDGLEQKI